MYHSSLDYDIVIVGAGITGLTCAALLNAHTQLRVAIVSSQPKGILCDSKELFDGRVSALTHGSFEILHSLKITEKLRKPGQFNQIHVWDSAHHFLNFSRSRPLGYIVNNQDLKHCLLSHIASKKNLTCLYHLSLKAIEKENKYVKLHFQSGESCTATLVIGSDGIDSTVRRLSGMTCVQKDYHQKALVTVVSHCNAHQNIAKQFFLETGPLGLLPLANTQHTAIVWSAASQYVDMLHQLSNEAFKIILNRYTGTQLGTINDVGIRYDYPLTYYHSHPYIKDNIALIGDAAHRIHPLAGQGLNLGLADCQSLLKTILHANRIQRSIGVSASLRPYERQQRFRNQLMMTSIHMIAYWFDQRQYCLKKCRIQSMKVLQQIPFLKQWIIYYASD